MGRLVRLERVDVGRCRRQPRQVERHPPNERPPIGRTDRLQPLLGQLRREKGVDGVRRLSGHRDLRHRRISDRLERPMLPLLVGRLPGAGLLRRGRTSVVGPGSPGLDPFFHDRDLVARQERAGRHFDPAVVLDRGNEQALRGIARHDRRTAVAPLHERRSRIEPQARLRLVVAVALHALLEQERPDLPLEEFVVTARRGLGSLKMAARHDTEGQPARCPHQPEAERAQCCSCLAVHGEPPSIERLLRPLET